MRVMGYVRVSTEEQSTAGVSLEVQADKVRLFTELHGLTLVEVVADPGQSAKSLDRPGLARVLTLLEGGGAEGVVIAKLDRLTRSVRDLATLLDRYFGETGGHQLLSVGDSIDTRTAAGRLVLNVLMSVAQWERETIVERTRSALEHKRSRGERIGGIPFGWDLDGDGKRLNPNPREQEILGRIVRWRADGWPLRRIAAELTARQVPPKAGGTAWSHSTITRILGRRP